MDDRYFVEGRVLNPELIRSEMSWHVVNPGRVAPASWPSDSQHTIPLTHDEWIVCQDSLKHKLPNPSICIEPSQTCRVDIMSPGCHAQAVWKKDNMWSPRRGHGAAIANNNIFVIGGQAREYARIDDSRLVRGIDGQKRVDTVRDFSTIREDIVLKNDIWISNDGKGESWKLVNPGCKDPQLEVLMQTEVWTRDLSDPNLPKIIGSLGSKCYRSSDCYGIAECKALGNTSEMVCVCPMFGPREHHAVAVQHRFSIQEDNSTFAEDVIYVVGGFTSVKQAFCSNRSCGPTDGYRLAIDDAWMSSDGVNWFQFKPAFSTRSSFVGRGSHTALVVQATFQKDIVKSDQMDRLIILGGESLNPKELNTTHLHDVWQVYLPTKPCCIPDKGCIDKSKIQDVACLPRYSDWMAVTQNAEWPGRSSHTSVYEPPSPINSFQHSIYLMGGKNSAQVFSDVWRWGLENDESWHCDFCGASPPVEKKNSTTTASLTYDAYSDIRSPLTALQRFELPVLDNSGKLLNFTSHSHSSFVSDADLSVMASTGVTTIEELASADLYSILKLRGFDYPGRHAREVPNICYLRAISIAFVGKCAINDYPDSFFHMKSVRRIGQPVIERPSELCGRGGDTKPCVASDWDGCTPIPGVSAVDIHGLGDVAVPQTEHNVSHVMEEMFCRQVPGDRYLGASAFLDNKVVVLGGMANNGTHLYRDVWSRDEVFPHAIITTKPESQSPQSTFFFDSNEAGAHVFEYKILRDGVDVIPWTVTTKTLGVDVSWLDDKKGGPGKGWYTLFVRAVDPSGNKDNRFSTHTNVYKWYYVPPIPWGAVSGCILAFLVLVLVGYCEYRRRKRKATLQRFALRRMRRKFKLKSVNQELNEEIFHGNIVSNLHRRKNSEVRRKIAFFVLSLCSLF